MINAKRLLELMEETVKEAAKSVAEDDRIHPRVGAVLADSEGRELVRAHRGEIPKCHAEFVLLKKAEDRNIDLSNCVLFASLEPCTHRGVEKVPCAERVAASGVPQVFIGTLDPNPAITGRGDSFLQYVGLEVERYPGHVAKKLWKLNANFFNEYRQQHVRVQSLYGAPGAEVTSLVRRPLLAEERNGRLQQTLDLISGSQDDVWICAGGLSWYREASLTLLGAALDQRSVRLVCSSGGRHESASSDYEAARAAALSIGATVVELARPFLFRGTIVAPNTEMAASIIIDQGNAHLFRLPGDRALLSMVISEYERCWNANAQQRGTPPRIREVPAEEALAALRGHVPLYSDWALSMENVSTDRLLPLTKHLETFKVFRVNQLEALRRRHGIPAIACIEGSPWPITPPVVERLPDGRCVVIDGAHRAYGALLRGEADIEAVVVENPGVGLPAEPLEGWNDVHCFATKLRREDRYSHYKPELFRPIRNAFRHLTGL